MRRIFALIFFSASSLIAEPVTHTCRDQVFSYERSPRPFSKYIRLAQTGERRRGFVELPVSYNADDLNFCATSFMKGGSCASTVNTPLQELGLLPNYPLVFESPTFLAAYVYLRSLDKTAEFKPVTYGNPNFLTGAGPALDLILPLAPVVGILGAHYSFRGLIQHEMPPQELARLTAVLLASYGSLVVTLQNARDLLMSYAARNSWKQRYSISRERELTKGSP
jgi:hypothetical protein